jgi:hypothetical protein
MPTARFPTAIATQADLKLAANLVKSSLATSITASDTIVTVRDGSQFQPNMLLSIDQEIMAAGAVNGNNITIAQRGFDGTTAAPHAASAIVSVFIDAWHHNQPAAEIMAIENFLGPNGQNLTPSITSGSYIFPPQTPGGNLIAGTNVITLSPVPKGVNATDQGHWLYISGGTGTAEAVPITGGTAVAGASSGTVIVTCANTHTGAWTIQTATSGIEEALVALGAPGQVQIPSGQWIIHGPITIPAPVTSGWQSYAIVGMGRLVSTLLIAADFPLTVSGVFIPLYTATSCPGPRWSDFGVVFPQNYTLPVSGMTHWPPVIRSNNISAGSVLRLYISGAWQAVVVTGSSQVIGVWTFDDIEVSGYGPGVFSFDNAADTMRFSKIHVWPFQNSYASGSGNGIFDPAVVGLSIGQAASVMITDSYFLCGTGIRFVGVNGSAVITIANSGFDVFGVIDMSRPAGGIQANFTNCYFFQVASQAGFTPPSAIFVYGSSAPNLTVSNCSFYRSGNQPLASIVGPAGFNPEYGQVSFIGNLIFNGSNVAASVPLFDITNTTGAPLRVKIAENQISYSNNLTFTNPMLRVTGTGTALTFQNNVNAGSGSGTWLSIASDDEHFISGNVITGPLGSWTCNLPTSKAVGYYQDGRFEYAPPAPVSNVTGPNAVAVSGYNASYICNAAGGAIQLNLPFASQSRGQVFRLKKVDASANAVGFVPGGPDTIEGVNSTRNVTTQYATLAVISDGTGWWLS